jgi:hypothetical protein
MICVDHFLHAFVHRKHEGLFFWGGLMAIKCVSTTFNNHLYGMIMDQAPKVWISWDLVKTLGWSYELGDVSYEFSLDSHDFDQGGGLLSFLRQNWSVYLVGGWAQPLWKIWVRQMGVGNSQYMESHKIHVPVTTNQQHGYKTCTTLPRTVGGNPLTYGIECPVLTCHNLQMPKLDSWKWWTRIFERTSRISTNTHIYSCRFARPIDGKLGEFLRNNQH